MSRKAPTIGILAGMGPASTAPFLELVLAQCRAQYDAHDDIDFPKMMICSQPAPFFHDRPVDHAAVEAATIEGLRDLETAGAKFIAIACNSVHLYYDRLAAAVRTPVLNIVEIALDALPEGSRRIAMAASRPTAASGLYQRAATARGFLVVEPDWQSEIDDLQDLVKAEIDHEAVRQKWRQFFAHLEAVEVDAVVIGCLDLSGVVRHAVSPCPLVDAGETLAAHMVREWRRLCVA